MMTTWVEQVAYATFAQENPARPPQAVQPLPMLAAANAVAAAAIRDVAAAAIDQRSDSLPARVRERAAELGYDQGSGCWQAGDHGGRLWLVVRRVADFLTADPPVGCPTVKLWALAYPEIVAAVEAYPENFNCAAEAALPLFETPVGG